MSDKLSRLVEDLKRAHGDNLASVVLFGSAAAGNHIEGRSDLNVLVVLNRITPEDLRAAHPVITEWRKAGNSLPIYFTRDEMASSSDVFPIEFSDMTEIHRVLYGIDPFDGLRISTTNLRLQCEFELRGKLIRLRDLYIPNSGDVERLSRLMAESLSSFAVLFRHVLRLLGEEPPKKKREVVLSLASRLNLDREPFLKILSVREDNKKLVEAEAHQVFAGYLAQIERVIEAVDKI